MDVKRIRKRAEEEFINALSRFYQRHFTSLKSELQRGKRPKLTNETAKNKRVVQSKSSLQADTTNVNRIGNSLMEKLSQCNEMFAKLQEMTNEQVEKYTGLFPEYRNIKPREKGNSSGYDDALQTNGDIPIHVLHIVSPTGSEERLCKR